MDLNLDDVDLFHDPSNICRSIREPPKPLASPLEEILRHSWRK